jgi:hypothetical protein
MTDQERQMLIATANNLLDQLTLHGTEYAELREGLTEFVITLSEPQPIINVSENIQQTVNVEETKKIINNGM